MWRAFDLVTGDGLVVGGECLVGVCLRPQEYRSSAWTRGYGVARCMHGNKKEPREIWMRLLVFVAALSSCAELDLPRISSWRSEQ